MQQNVKGHTRAKEPAGDLEAASNISQVPLSPPGSCTGRPRRLSISRHGTGLVLYLRRGGREVKVTKSDAVADSDWLKAAHLRANPIADTVQLTPLHSGPVIYIDGQRILRSGSPLEIRATQRISFANHPICYIAIPAPRLLSSSSHRGCTSPPLMTSPNSMAVSRHGRFVTQSRSGQQKKFSPSKPKPAPLLPCTSRSQPPLRLAEVDQRGVAKFTSSSTEVLPIPAASTKTVSPPDSASRDSVAASVPLFGKHAPELRQSLSSLASDGTAGTAKSPAENANAFLPAEKIKITSSLSTGKAPALPLQQRTAPAAGVSEKAVYAVATAAVAPPCASSEEGQTDGADCTPPKSLNADRFPSQSLPCDEKAEAGLRGDKASLDSLHGAHQSRVHSQTKQCWSLGSVTSVLSPDWEALHAAEGDTPPPKAKGIYQYSCGSVGFDEALVALHGRRAAFKGTSAKAAGWPRFLRRTPLPHRAAAALSVSHNFRGHSVSRLNESTPLDAKGVNKKTVTDSTFLSEDETLNALSSALSSEPIASENAGQGPYLREKLHLRSRVTVVPFVVEDFGDTHRYRPLASLVDPQRLSNTRRGAVSAGDSASAEMYDRFSGVPWQYPAVADEMVTPRTEAYVRDVLRRHPKSTQAAEDAMFLHCALRRSYKKDTNTFSYMDSPAFVKLIYMRFSSLLMAVKERLEEGRPVLHLTSPVLCGGDLFGCFSSLMMLLDHVAYFTHWSSIHTQLVLLGNYVDFGWHSVEVCMLLCCWVYLQPEKVHLLRGPHEDPAVNGSYVLLGKRCLRYKCRQRFGSRRGLLLWKQINSVFALLPVAAVIDERVLATHGGVPRLRASPPLSSEENRDVTAGREHRVSVPVNRLYSGTSGLPTPASSSARTPLSFLCHTAANLSLPEHLHAWAPASVDTDSSGARNTLFSPFSSLSMQHHRLAAPVARGLPDVSTGEHRETPGGKAPTGLLLPPSRHTSHVNNCGEPLRRSTKFPSEASEVVSLTSIPLCPTPSREVISSPCEGLRDSARVGRCGVDAALTLSVVASSAPVVSQLDRISPRGVAMQEEVDSCGTYKRCLPSSLSVTSANVDRSQAREAQEPVADALQSPMHDLEGENEPSENDFAALLAAMHKGEYSFRSLQEGSASENEGAARRLRLVRELLWNRPRSATAKILMPEEEFMTDENGEAVVPWWRPDRVGICRGCRSSGYAHQCCHTFGTGALLHFLLRFRFSLVICGAPEDPSEVFGARVAEEGRLVTLSTCRRRCKEELQAAACLVGSDTLRLFTWGAQELADSLGQVSLHSLPGIREAEAEREGFENFVCDTLQARLRDYKVVGPHNEWSLRSAHRAYLEHRRAAQAPSGDKVLASLRAWPK